MCMYIYMIDYWLTSSEQYINAREYRTSNQKWTIQINWQHRVYNTKKNKIKTQYFMCWTPLYANKHK